MSLPGQRIEKPDALDRPSREVHAKRERIDINADRYQRQNRPCVPVRERDQRRDQHQDEIKWQNVEIAELMREQDEPDMRLDGIVEDGGGVVPVEQERRVEQNRGAGEKRDRQPGYDGLREVNRQRAAPEAKHQPFPRVRSRGTVDELAQRPTREKDEKLRRVRDRYVAKGEALEKIAGNVIDENREKSEPAPKVDLIWFAHACFLNGPRSSRSRGSRPERDNIDAAPNIARARPAPYVAPGCRSRRRPESRFGRGQGGFGPNRKFNPLPPPVATLAPPKLAAYDASQYCDAPMRVVEGPPRLRLNGQTEADADFAGLRFERRC